MLRLQLKLFGVQDGKLGDGIAPVAVRLNPFLRHIVLREPQELFKRFIVREYGRRLRYLPELVIERLNRVRRVHRPADCFGIREERGELAPLVFPALEVRLVARPFFFDLFQCLAPGVFRRRGIDRLEILAE